MTGRIAVEERRARLAIRHRLTSTARAEGAREVARDVVALHATDPASVFLAAFARMRSPASADVERALYDERTLVRMLGMRRTVFVVPVELAPVVQSACTRAIAVKERRKLVGFIEDSRIAKDAGRWLRKVERETLAALVASGEATATELAEEVPALRRQLVVGKGTKWETRQAVSSRVLFQLAAEGRIVRGRPRGSWTSSQYRWAPIETWLGGPGEPWSTAAAQAELARRWLAAFGPATAADLKWWTGWTAAEVRAAVAEVGAAEVGLGGVTGLVLADDLEPVAAPDPWVALLPGLDPTVMGWSKRAWYLGAHAPALFDRSGNPGPTVWCDGRVVGGWAQRVDGEVVWRLLEDVGADAAGAVEAAAAQLAGLLGETRVTPRFRTPLERELTA